MSSLVNMIELNAKNNDRSKSFIIKSQKIKKKKIGFSQ